MIRSSMASARRVGASALAVATIASGLSLTTGPSPASATEAAAPKLGDVRGQVNLAMRNGLVYSSPIVGTWTPSTSTYGRDIDGYRDYQSASATPRYTVIDSGRNDGKFALRASSGSCLGMTSLYTNELFAIGDRDTELQSEWKMKSGQPAKFLQPSSACTTAPFSFDGTYLSYNGSRVGKDVFIPGNSSLEEGRQRWWENNKWGAWSAWQTTRNINVEGWGTGGTPSPLAGDVEAMLPGPKVPSVTAAFPDDRDQQAVVTVKGQARASIELKEGSTAVASGGADADGNFTYSVPAPGDGSRKTFSATQTVDGKTSDAGTASLQYSQVTIESPKYQDEVDESPITVEGTGEAGAEVIVSVNGTAARPVEVRADGSWNRAVNLPAGEATIVASQRSKGANTTTSTVVVNEGESSVPAPTARVTFPENVEQRATMAGTGAPGAQIEVFDGTQKVGSATVNTNGNWGTQLLAVGNGVRELTVIQTLDGTTQQTTIDADYGTELTVTTPAPSTSARVTLTGTGTPGAKIEFRDGTNTVRTVHAAADGTWSSTGTFRPGTAQVRVASLSKGAVVVRKDTTVDVTIATRPLELTSPTKDDADNDRIPDGNVTFTGTATPYATIQFATWPNGQGREVFTTYADADGNWSATGWLAQSHYRLSGTQRTVVGDVTHYEMFPFSTVGFRTLQVEGPKEGDVVIAGLNSFTGTATPGATVEVTRKDTGQVIARGTAEGAEGIWLANADLRADVPYPLQATQTALNGRTDTVDLGTITPVTSQGITDLAFTHDGTLNGNNITFTFKAQPGAEVSVWTGPKDQAGTDKPWIREMAAGVADKYGHVTIAGYAAPNNPYNLKVYAGTTSVDYTITTTPTK